MGFPRQGYWSGCHFHLQGLFLDQGLNPHLLHWLEHIPLNHWGSPRIWVSQTIFQDWFFHFFILEVEKYCLEKDIPFNNLATRRYLGPPPICGQLSLNIKVVHLPQNTMSLIEPISEGVIVTFKKYDLCHAFCQAVKVSDKSGTTLRQFWKDSNIYKAIKKFTLLGMRLQLSS